VRSAAGDSLRVHDASAAPGRTIILREPRLFGPARRLVHSTVDLVRRTDALGGMGPGYALALGGHLATPLGEGEDADRIRRLLSAAKLSYNAIVAPGCRADTTDLLLGDRGEKLAVGLRDASAHVRASALGCDRCTAAICVVCSLPAQVSSDLLERLGGCRMLAPSLRYVRDAGFRRALARADIVAMNRREWQAAGCPAEALHPGALAIVTAGARGADILWRTADGHERLEVPALRREHVADANRAGEAFAAGFVGALTARGALDARGRLTLDRPALADAAWDASIAASLELEITETAFPDRADVLTERRRHPRPE
jgi:sugar/nucleoside kinase (ribokinase family)